jgi:hypothetical protein
MLSACSVDPTDQFFPLDAVNDTNSELIVDQCDVKCTSFHDHADLKPGELMAENVSDAGIPEWFQVTAVDGKRVGCLVAKFSHKETKARIGLSKAQPCPLEILH